nr:MFS transporter [Marivibrio halodurans]
MFPAMILRFEAATGLARTDLSAVFTLSIGFSALCSPIAGRLIDRGHGPRVLAGSAGLGGVALAGLAVADGFWSFAALWAVIGLAMGGALYIPCFSLVTRARGPGARRAITLITLVAGFAGTLAFPCAHLLSDLLGWRGPLIVFSALILGIALPLAGMAARRLEAEYAPRGVPADEAHETHPTEPDRGLRYMTHPSFWLLAVCFAALALTHGICVTHLLPILEERAVDPDIAVLAAAAIGPMQVLGRLAMLAVEHRVTNRAITLACFLALALAVLALMAAAATPLMLLPFVALLGSGAGVSSIMKPVVTRDILGEEGFGAVSGALAVPFLAAFALAPVAGALIWRTGGYDLVLQTLLAVSVIGLTAFAFASRKGRET